MIFSRAQASCALSLVSCCLLVAVAKAEERSAEDWFQLMIQAQQELSYAGTISYFDGQEMTTLWYSHIVEHGEVHERVTNLNGRPRSFIREGGSVFLQLGADDELLKLRDKLEREQVSSTFQPQFGKIDDTYTIEFDGKDRIAGRAAACISMIPNEGDRYSIHLWIDEGTYALLRYDMRDDDRRPIKIWQFTEFETGELDRDKHSFSGHTHPNLEMHIKQSENQDEPIEESDVNWHLGWIPKGFQRFSSQGLDDSIGSEAARHVMYSDGMVPLMVIVEPISESHNQLTAETISGPTVVVSHTVQDNDGKSQLVTVVGDLPAKTVWRVARGVKFDP